MTDVQARTGGGPLPAVCDESVQPGTRAPRRAVLIGAGALGASCFLAACSSPSPNPNGSDFNNNPAPAGSAAGTDSPTGTVLATTAEVPVGGGIIKGAYVITQPSQGSFKAFSKVCTHQGCDVNKIDGGVIICPCHGSRYSIEDGSVQVGPAPRALPEVAVKVNGKDVVKA